MELGNPFELRKALPNIWMTPGQRTPLHRNVHPERIGNMKYHITVLPRKKVFTVSAGTNLLKALRDAGLSPDAPCGGSGKCGKCKVTVDGQELLSCRYTVDSDITVALPETSSVSILTAGSAEISEADPLQEGYLIAVDIGTTTVVCFLLSPEGKELAVESMLNPQSSFGADVISRIRQALNGEMDALTNCIRRGISRLIGNCCKKAGIREAEISVVSIVGNPCMQQLFLGILPQNLAGVPFAPVLTKAEILKASDYLPDCTNGCLLTIADISGYVGADTVACVLASEMYKSEETLLLVDIGTNGEMVLIHEGKMIACSTAAGPALEGADIRFGMRGAAGAIDHVWEENGDLRCSVIGGGEPTGICGSGIIDAVAVLLNQKKLNQRGRIRSAEELDGQRVLYLSEKIYLTQDDIRQVQMAKGAIAAGIRLMCSYFGNTPEDIDKVLLAGAFGSFLNPDRACRMELLPRSLPEKITACGNLAGLGAKLIAMDKKQFLLTQELAEKIRFIELAQMPDFQKVFAKCMTFPE